MCECVKGYVCPLHTASRHNPLKPPKDKKGMSIRQATNTLRGTSINSYYREPFSSAFRTLQGFLTKKINDRRRIMSKLEVYEYANSASAPRSVYNTPSEPQNVRECLAEIDGRGMRELSSESRTFLKDYIHAANSMVRPISMIEFVKRGGSRYAYDRIPFYWASHIEKKMLNEH